MRAARLHKAYDVRMEEVPAPVAGPGEVLVRVRAVSICPSDWRLYADGHASGVVPDHPMIQGHEFSGEVAALGEGVSGPAVGTAVAVEPTWACGKCDLCKQGLTNLCRNVIFPSFPQRDGALAEYIACPAHAVAPLPEGTGYAVGALIEPLGVGLHAVRLSGIVERGTWNVEGEPGLVFLGAGAIGMCTVLCARVKGARQIAVVEPVAARREWPERLGCAPAVGSWEELQAQGVEGEVVFECSGESAAVEQAMRLARPGGKVVVVGIPHPDVVSFDSTIARRKELTVIFARRSRNCLEESLHLLATGQVDLAALPTKDYTLEETKQALDDTAARVGEVLRAIVWP